MSDKYLDQVRQVTMVWRKILSTKEFESITVAKWQALDAEISRFARQAAADATRAERNRHVPLLNAAEDLCNLVDGYSGLGADAERAVERTRAAIRSAEPDAASDNPQ